MTVDLDRNYAALEQILSLPTMASYLQSYRQDLEGDRLRLVDAGHASFTYLWDVRATGCDAYALGIHRHVNEHALAWIGMAEREAPGYVRLFAVHRGVARELTPTQARQLLASTPDRYQVGPDGTVTFSAGSEATVIAQARLVDVATGTDRSSVLHFRCVDPAMPTSHFAALWWLQFTTLQQLGPRYPVREVRVDGSPILAAIANRRAS